MIKTIIFDLDDTLYDCTAQLLRPALENVAKRFHKNVKEKKLEHLFEELVTLFQKHSSRDYIFDFLFKKYKIPTEDQDLLKSECMELYFTSSIPTNITPFKGMKKMLQNLKEEYPLYIVTKGIPKRQEEKIDVLSIRPFFKKVLVTEEGKGILFKSIMDEESLKPSEVCVVGDSLISEIKTGNTLKMTTVRVRQGKRRHETPNSKIEKPNYEIDKITDLSELLKKLN